MGIIWTILVGFVVGLIARAVMPGTQSLGIILTTLLGIGGSLAASYIGQAVGWYRAGEGAGFIGAVVGALLLLGIYGLVTRSRSGGD
ncbi:MAG TPA: GlsB/YeaQ/YmgE family stress response membrane protein [Albitalea sp.]|uniref:GlsB/YeaQ/YmgE family stress response membrane protein n=1 Tax=Piscinibacter sp. TaxID=1903157 RepID=UPI002ED20FBF